MVPTETEFAHGLARPHDVVQSLFGMWAQAPVIADAADECGGRAEELVPRVNKYYRSLFHEPERLSRVRTAQLRFPLMTDPVLLAGECRGTRRAKPERCRS